MSMHHQVEKDHVGCSSARDVATLIADAADAGLTAYDARTITNGYASTRNATDGNVVTRNAYARNADEYAARYDGNAYGKSVVPSVTWYKKNLNSLNTI